MQKKELDFYSILNVPRNATQEYITIAYRKLAIKCHPKRDKCLAIAFNPPEGIDDDFRFPLLKELPQWCFINEAYDILSNPLRREIYDRHGHAGLLNGVALPHGYFNPYLYHGDYMKTYNEVFSTRSPYMNLVDGITKPPPLYSNENGIGVKIKDRPIEKSIQLDLKEIYFGTIKRMQILRNEFVDGDKTKTEIKEKVLMIPIAAGTECGTRIIFRGEGDQHPTKIPCDIIFITADKPHEIYERKNNDLHMQYNINLKQAFCGFKIIIKTIDDRKLKMAINDVITPGYVKEIKDEGLPKLKEKKKGNLFVHFNVKFPLVVPRDLRLKFVEWFNEVKEFEKNEKK